MIDYDCTDCTLEGFELDGKWHIMPALCDKHYQEWLARMYRIIEYRATHLCLDSNKQKSV